MYIFASLFVSLWMMDGVIKMTSVEHFGLFSISKYERK